MTLNQLSKYTLRALTLQKCSLWEVLHMFKLIVYSHGRVSGSVCYLTMDFFFFLPHKTFVWRDSPGIALLWCFKWERNQTFRHSVTQVMNCRMDCALHWQAKHHGNIWERQDREKRSGVWVLTWIKGGEGGPGETERTGGAVSMLADVEKSLWTKTWFTLGW